MRLKSAKNLVLVAAIYNAGALLVFLTPGALPFVGVREPYSPFWIWLPSLLALFGSIVLYLSAKDLTKYGAFPYYNGIVRVIFAAVAFILDFGSSAGIFIGLIAIGDLLLGLLCIIIIPWSLRKNHRQLLFNQL